MTLLERISAAAARLDQIDYYELLGLERDVPGADVLDRYYRLAARLHPDRFARLGRPEHLRAATRVAARIGEARRVLCDPKLRAEYDQGLAQGRKRLRTKDRHLSRPPPDEREPTKLLARQLCEQARRHLVAGDRRRARGTLELARQYEPESAEIADLFDRLEGPRPAPSATDGATTSSAPAVGSPSAPAGAPAARREGRKHPRYPVTLAVALRLPSWKHVELLFTENLSKGGMFLKTRRSLPLHSEITLRILAPSRDEVDLRARVVHISPEGSAHGAGVGLRFLDVSPKAQQAIAALLSRGVVTGAHAPSAPPHAPPRTSVCDQPATPSRDELIARLRSMRGRAAYEVLGLSPDADRPAIVRAYRHVIEQYSPARLGKLDDDRAEVVKVLCAYARYAYEEAQRSAAYAAA